MGSRALAGPNIANGTCIVSIKTSSLAVHPLSYTSPASSQRKNVRHNVGRQGTAYIYLGEGNHGQEDCEKHAWCSKSLVVTVPRKSFLSPWSFDR
ncbi:hypothetical protein HYQ46_010779 [Verticillium longisporum]|nr:hypothetical protein HYQ46_010779 [Verticillium longisporum]